MRIVKLNNELNLHSEILPKIKRLTLIYYKVFIVIEEINSKPVVYI